MKSYNNNGEKTSFYYYRDYNQHQVDLVFIKEGTLYAVETKFGENHSLKDVASFKELDSTQYIKGKRCIVCTSESLSALSSNVLIVPIKSI